MTPIQHLSNLDNVNVAVVGSRDFAEPMLLRETLDRWLTLWKHPTIVTGTLPKYESMSLQKGADQLAVLYAREKMIPYMVFEAEWDKHGKAAGNIRNTPIILHSDVVIAFWDMQSKGTRDSLGKAKRFNKAIIIVNLLDKSEMLNPRYF